MRENNSNIVNIDDVDDETLALLIQFLHFEPLGDLNWEAVVKLYYAADKYQIEKLRTECTSLLQLSAENVCEAFILSDMHQDEDLKRSAQEFFCENSKIILRSEEWKDLLLSRPKLAVDILHVLADKL